MTKKNRRVAPPGSLGDRLIKARVEVAKITQSALADRSGVSQKTISKIERGDQDGSTQVAQLARACGVAVEWLATGAGDMVPAIASTRAEEPRGSYRALSDAALEIARAWGELSAISQDHVRRQIELLRGADENSGRRRAVQQDVRIKRGVMESGAREKRRRSVRKRTP